MSFGQLFDNNKSYPPPSSYGVPISSTLFKLDDTIKTDFKSINEANNQLPEMITSKPAATFTSSTGSLVNLPSQSGLPIFDSNNAQLNNLPDVFSTSLPPLMLPNFQVENSETNSPNLLSSPPLEIRPPPINSPNLFAPLTTSNPLITTSAPIYTLPKDDLFDNIFQTNMEEKLPINKPEMTINNQLPPIQGQQQFSSFTTKTNEKSKETTVLSSTDEPKQSYNKPEVHVIHLDGPYGKLNIPYLYGNNYQLPITRQPTPNVVVYIIKDHAGTYTYPYP